MFSNIRMDPCIIFAKIRPAWTSFNYTYNNEEQEQSSMQLELPKTNPRKAMDRKGLGQFILKIENIRILAHYDNKTDISL